MIYGTSKATQEAAKHRELPRYGVAGHAKTCDGRARYSIRHEAGRYRLARSCACGTVSRHAKEDHASFAEAWELLRRLDG